MTPLSCDMVSNVCLFRNDVTKTESRKECNRLFDRDPSTSWIQITNDNLCFGQAAGGIDACQVKKCFVCQVITSNIHCGHILSNIICLQIATYIGGLIGNPYTKQVNGSFQENRSYLPLQVFVPTCTYRTKYQEFRCILDFLVECMTPYIISINLPDIILIFLTKNFSKIALKNSEILKGVQDQIFISR